MAHKKGVGSSKNGRESESKRLGVKLFGGEFAKAGNIIIRQRGTAHHPGENVGIGKDHTIYALVDGTVVFRKTKNNRSYISVQSISAQSVTSATLPEDVTTPVADVTKKKVTKAAEVAEATVTEEVDAAVAEAAEQTVAAPKRASKKKAAAEES